MNFAILFCAFFLENANALKFYAKTTNNFLKDENSVSRRELKKAKENDKFFASEVCGNDNVEARAYKESIAYMMMQWSPVTFYPMACAADSMTTFTADPESAHCVEEARKYKEKFFPRLGIEDNDVGFWEVLYDFGLGSWDEEKTGVQDVGRIKLLAVPQTLTRYWSNHKNRIQDTSQLGKLCFLFFSGSTTRSDWIANVKIESTDFCGLPGKWHSGYVNTWRSIMTHPSWAMLLKKIPLNNCDPAFGISGHSLGGALAFLTSACINQGDVTSADYKLLGQDFSVPHPSFKGRPTLYVKACVVFGCPGVVQDLGAHNSLAPRHMLKDNFDLTKESDIWGGGFWFGNFIVGRPTHGKDWVPDPATEVGQSLAGYTLPYGLLFHEGQFVYFKRDFVEFANKTRFDYHLNHPYRKDLAQLLGPETAQSILIHDLHHTSQYVYAAKQVWYGFADTDFSNELCLKERADWMLDCCCGIITPRPKWKYWPSWYIDLADGWAWEPPASCESIARGCRGR